MPPTVGKLTKLVHLFLTDNLLETLPIELTGCVSLRKIQAASNRICSVPEGLEAMPELEFMRLPCNRLTVRPAGPRTLATRLCRAPLLCCRGRDPLARRWSLL